MFKVVFICSTLKRTGPTNVLFNLISNFDRKEVSSTIITLSPELEDSRAEDFRELNIDILCLGLSHSNFSIIKNSKLINTLCALQPDICHPFGFRADLLCCGKNIQKQFKVVSSIYNYPWDDYPMLYGKIKGSLMAYLHIKVLSKYKKVITCSDFIVKMLHNKSLDNVERVYTGVDENLFMPARLEEKRSERGKLQIPSQAIIFIFVGYLIKRKDPETLVKAFAKFNHKYPALSSKTKLFVMGDGPLMNKCKDIYCQENICYLGNQQDTRPWLKISDVYISPSLSEGFPTAVLEALAMGLPCILSDIAPHREMASKLADSCFFNIENVDELSEFFAQMCNVDLLSASKSSREYFLSNLSAKIMSENHINIYKKL